jgi:spore maturation protein CgeB
LKVAVLGKIGSVIHWLEDCVGGLTAEGHEVCVGVTRNPAVSRVIEDALLSEAIGAPMAVGIARKIRRFAPDLILVIGAYEIPRPILERVAAIPGRAPLIAWIGDVFTQAAAPVAALFDAMAYTDSGLIERHRQLNFAPPALYLPHAVNPQPPPLASLPRRPLMVFIANPTPHRRSVIGALDHPVALYGPGWERPFADHEVHPRKVPSRKVAALYASHLAALNIRNENNILVGLNQRNFDPYVFGTPVVTDAQPDLEGCFEEGAEVLVYRDAAELNEIYARLRKSPGAAAKVGEAGRRRVLADHTYARRLATLAAGA